MPLVSETLPLASGTLPEEDGHAVWRQTFGDTTKPMILLMHGGPAGALRPACRGSPTRRTGTS
jgi:hypothetical protein